MTEFSRKQAILFDMDGTLVDNIPFHSSAWISFLHTHGIDIKPEEFQAQNHGNIGEMIRRFFGSSLPDALVRSLGQEKEQTYRHLYRHHIRSVEGLTSLLQKMEHMHIKAALVTMGDMPNIDFVVDSLHIRPWFASITGGHEVEKGKPDPEIYLLALKKLNVPASACLVVEDSPGGVEAARRAGIDVVGITTSHNETELLQAGCVAAISDFHDLARLLGNDRNSIAP